MPSFSAKPLESHAEPVAAVRTTPPVIHDVRPGAAPRDLPPLHHLMPKIAAGDRIAFKILYEMTSKRLLGVASRFLWRRDAAEDALQDAYLKIWSGSGTFDAERGDPWSWMVQIVRNASIDRLRRERTVHDDIDELTDVLQAPSVPTDNLVDLDRRLAALTPLQRDLILMAFVFGYSNQEVADRLNVSLPTAKNWIYRTARVVREPDAP